jgi:hypothetical protein
VDPSDYVNMAIWKASANGHVEVVEVLLSNPRVDPSAKDNEAIRAASKGGHVEVVQLLSQHQKVIDTFKVISLDPYPSSIHPYLEKFTANYIPFIIEDFTSKYDL